MAEKNPEGGDVAALESEFAKQEEELKRLDMELEESKNSKPDCLDKEEEDAGGENVNAA